MTRQVAIIINVISVVLNAGFNIRFTYPVSLAFFRKNTNETGILFLRFFDIVIGIIHESPFSVSYYTKPVVKMEGGGITEKSY